MLSQKSEVLFITPYPVGVAPGQRFRFEQYFGLLEQNGYEISVSSFLSVKGYQILYRNEIIKKIGIIFFGFAKRLFLLFSIRKYDFIFIFREATPIGPPIFEFVISRVFKKKIIYDFDDAIWLNDPSEEGTFLAWLKWKRKVIKICKWSNKISAGNQYLVDFARSYNKNTTINPTTIDTKKMHNCELYNSSNLGLYNESNQGPNHKKSIPEELLVIGWTGSHSTLKYLEEVIPILTELEKSIRFEFRVIANRNPNLKLRSLKFVPWNKETEVEDLLKMDIGIMPLTNDKWSRGKCGFKLLQYMALNIPVVASPVGVNTEIVEDGVVGFLSNSHQEWRNKLELLLNDKQLRKQLGNNGRQKVIKDYSVLNNSDNFLSLFEKKE